MKAHIDGARQHLGRLNKLAGKTEAAERGIMARAEKRLDEVTAAIERLRPGIESAPDASQERYTDLVKESGQLHIIITKARTALS